jgi:hypothetical protein
MKDHDDIIRLLREERPEASSLELDRIKQRVMQRASAPRKGQPMRSRLAILLMLVVGMLFGATGAGLAVQGFTDSGNDASIAQYPDDEEDGGVLGEEAESEDEGGGGTTEAEEVESGQVAEQVEAGDSLPFTGFAAIPVLAVGIALVGAGMVLRRRTPQDN